MISSEQKEICTEIATSDFDTAMYMHRWNMIADREFHELLKEYCWAREALADYIGWED